MAVSSNKTLDASGLSCPLPIVKTKKEIDTMSSGQVLEVISTDPGSKNDMAAWCNRTGNKLLESSEEGGKFKFYVQKS
ncbi:MAG: sulfurtransferase TusA family protein [Deltaproteobacteria bacterium]|jgi:Predicted redox protein, regulator of disulfide bond formation|uniref:Sulfurtransferase TusA family protein n=1 Tax=Candidatus Acidulodesulfobacterium acidiphilum TaxID=2597224 RepID=A0A520XBI4_9DELT|nr:sulfurtransferase TusA family protein [Deltaproteobacteria bacterium]RZV38549.1 MAG: sulfurtransferase TusA family protein [Candidatus Acidulodesulfobacterium acidiphilum]